MFFYKKDVAKALSASTNLAFHKIANKKAHVIAAGSYQGKIGVAIAYQK